MTMQILDNASQEQHNLPTSNICAVSPNEIFLSGKLSGVAHWGHLCHPEHETDEYWSTTHASHLQRGWIRQMGAPDSHGVELRASACPPPPFLHTRRLFRPFAPRRPKPMLKNRGGGCIHKTGGKRRYVGLRSRNHVPGAARWRIPCPS